MGAWVVRAGADEDGEAAELQFSFLDDQEVLHRRIADRAPLFSHWEVRVGVGFPQGLKPCPSY